MALALAAAAPAEGYLVTVRAVELKSEDGRWVTVAEPDNEVDLSAEEAGLSFFNSHGRIPEGRYVNVRVRFEKAPRAGSANWNLSSGRALVLSAGRDMDPLTVEDGSFIGVWFTLNLEDSSVKQVSLTVDEDSRTLAGSETVLSDLI